MTVGEHNRYRKIGDLPDLFHERTYSHSGVDHDSSFRADYKIAVKSDRRAFKVIDSVSHVCITDLGYEHPWAAGAFFVFFIHVPATSF